MSIVSFERQIGVYHFSSMSAALSLQVVFRISQPDQLHSLRGYTAPHSACRDLSGSLIRWVVRALGLG